MLAPNRLTIIQHNVRTWSNKRIQLQHIYSKYSPDIILLNEIQKGTETPNIKIPGYTTYTKTVDFGGTAICIKSNIQHKPLEDFETQLQAISISTKQGEIIIATDYIPPSKGYITFPDYYKLFRRQQPTFLLGDLNANHPIFNYAHTNTTGSNLAALLDRNIIKHIGPSFPTRIDHKSSKTPDIVIANNRAYHNIHLEQGPPNSSDHLPIIATISAYPIMIPIKPRKQYAKANWTKYSEEMLNLHPPPTHRLTPNEIDTLAENWTQRIVDSADKHIPTLTHRVIPGIKPGQDILNLENEIQLYQNILTTFGAHPLIYSILTSAKKQLNKLYWDLAKTQWNQTISKLDLERDPQKFFTAVKKMLGNSKTTRNHVRDAQNKILHDTAEQEEVFRKFWSRIFRNDQEDHLYDSDNINTVNEYISEHTDSIEPLPQADPNPFSIDFPQMTIKDITDSFARMRPRAPGLSGITSHHLKHLPPVMIQTYQTICNQSLATGYIPKIWKHAIIILIPKGNKSHYKVEEHRPISLLETPGKVLDRFINTTLITHLNSKELNHPDQHGFRKLRGTHTALATFHETIAKTSRQQNSILTVTLRDVSKAFDKVWTDGLQYKLLHLPLPTPLKRILCNFVTDRTAAIRVKDHVGPSFPLLSGVPQGACLSPSLYNLYTSALPVNPPPTNKTKLGQLQNILYADDISQITSTRRYNQHHQLHTSRAIQYVNDYEKQWKIKTNTGKFQAISLLKNPKKPLEIDNKIIQTTKTGKTLGLNFNRNGYGPQCSINQAKCSKKLHKLKRFKHLSIKNKTKLYKSTILPSLIYPSVPLHTSPEANLHKLQVIQNSSLKFILDKNHRHRITAAEMHRKVNIEPINVMLHRHAKKTWSTIKTFHPQLYDELANLPPLSSKKVIKYPSSRLLAEGPAPPPIYTFYKPRPPPTQPPPQNH